VPINLNKKRKEKGKKYCAMTLAKASHVSNYDARLGKSNLQAYCNHESVLNRDVSMFHCCNMKKN